MFFKKDLFLKEVSFGWERAGTMRLGKRKRVPVLWGANFVTNGWRKMWKAALFWVRC